MLKVAATEARYSSPSLVQPESEDQGYEVADTFDEMQLREELLCGIYTHGLEKPSALQRRAILPAIRGNDVIAQVQIGESATFVIPILQKIDTSNPQCQALILVPVREYALKIQQLVLALGDFMKVDCHACVGGTDVREDMAKLEAGAQVVVGTPGRVLDMISKRRALRTDSIKMFVLDEADQVLSHGLMDPVYRTVYDIFCLISKPQLITHGSQDQAYDVFRLSPKVQVLLSATMPQQALDVATKFACNPICIFAKHNTITLEGIKQFYKTVDREDGKIKTLCNLYETITISQAVIFCNTRRRVDWLCEEMTKRKFTVSAMHGDMDQRQREAVKKAFCSGALRILITTDLFPRFMNLPQVSLIINFDLPSQKEHYIHRLANCGHGVAINFVTGRDFRMLREIENFCNVRVEQLPKNIADLL